MSDKWKYTKLGLFEPHPDLSKFHVVTCISNPVMFASRYQLYADFAQHMKDSGVTLWTVEVAYANRPFEITQEGNPYHLQLRTDCEIWHKENMLNLIIQKLPSDWKYVACLDADIQFQRKDWAMATIQQLQHYQVVQVWSNAIDMGPNTQAFAQARSFCSRYIASGRPATPQNYNDYWHTGYGWAYRREALDQVGGLLDIAVLGSADFYMGWGLLGLMDKNLYNDVSSLPHRKKGFTQNYINRLLQWQDRARGLKRSIGCVDGTITHFWHGPKTKRNYNTRENILIDNEFDPDIDLTRTSTGLWALRVESDRQISLRDGIMGYMRSRDEDSIDF